MADSLCLTMAGCYLHLMPSHLMSSRTDCGNHAKGSCPPRSVGGKPSHVAIFARAGAFFLQFGPSCPGGVSFFSSHTGQCVITTFSMAVARCELVALVAHPVQNIERTTRTKTVDRSYYTKVGVCQTTHWKPVPFLAERFESIKQNVGIQK